MAYFCHNDITGLKIATMSLFGSNETDVSSSDLFVRTLFQNTSLCLLLKTSMSSVTFLWYDNTLVRSLLKKSVYDVMRQPFFGSKASDSAVSTFTLPMKVNTNITNEEFQPF